MNIILNSRPGEVIGKALVFGPSITINFSDTKQDIKDGALIPILVEGKITGFNFVTDKEELRRVAK